MLSIWTGAHFAPFRENAFWALVDVFGVGCPNPLDFFVYGSLSENHEWQRSSFRVFVDGAKKYQRRFRYGRECRCGFMRFSHSEISVEMETGYFSAFTSTDDEREPRAPC